MKRPGFLKSWLQKLPRFKLVTPVRVAASSLNQAKADDWEYLLVFLEAYQQRVKPDVPTNRLSEFTDAACGLILFNDLYGQVTNGGFIQLVQNGYAPNLFENPFSQDMARWGATDLAELVAQAADIYLKHREYLSQERAIPEFSNLYEEFKEFEPLEDRFYEIIEGQTSLIRAYVEQHASHFAHIEA